VIDILTTKA